MNTMKDLKLEVLDRLQHLDGRYLEDANDIGLEKMLGVIEVDENYHPDKIDGSFLDKNHEFWNEYVREINSELEVKDECQVAIRLLQSEGRFRMNSPENNDLDGVNVIVDHPTLQESSDFDVVVEEMNGTALLQIQTENGTYETTLHRK